MQIQTLSENDINETIEFSKQCEYLIAERSSIYWVLSQFFNNTCFIAKNDDTIIGILLGFLSQTDNKTGFIHSIGISKKHRRKGIASNLINEFEKAIKKLDGNVISLTTELDNANAIQFYETHGFSDRKEILKAGYKRILFSKNI